MTSRQIRQQFLDFFKSKGHRIVHSSPVVPFDDPTLLFTNAGMNQFKDVFLGAGTREYKRAADTQKCIRVSGKHNDLEEVGYDTYHHTLFEMLGNWSFGDYYKKEAIGWAWELLTEVWKLPKERLWATVYKDDEEAFDLWKSETDINPKHILKFAEKDNFWEMGETGPCGPCSEIHINVSDDFENPVYVNAGSPECIEIWNLVFIQYNRDETGKLTELPAKHVDTGMGFERVCAVLQNKKSNYDTDVFSPLIKKIEDMSGAKYKAREHQISMRVIADHIRALTFAIADGTSPSNDGRGYVLRRLLRRASRYGRKLNFIEPFLFNLVDVLVNTMGEVFPEIVEKTDYIKKIIKAEEENFNATLDRGIELFNNIITQQIIKIFKEKFPEPDLVSGSKDISRNDYLIRVDKWENNNYRNFIQVFLSQWNERWSVDHLGFIPTINNEDVFKLYDTFGFPVDLTNVMAKEKGFTIDEVGFTKLMEEQKERSRSVVRPRTGVLKFTGFPPEIVIKKIEEKTEFTGYDELKTKAKITNLINDGENTLVILDKSPFYVESGGQTDDFGKIIIGNNTFDVIDVARIENQIIHVINYDKNGLLRIGIEVIAEVDEVRRWDIMRNHSVTHFLHKALRIVLGTHVQQAGSFVGPDRLRFDFTHFVKLTLDEIHKIETLVNEQLRRNLPLTHHRDTPFEEAKKMGAIMFFGDKYGDRVNVVQFGDFTMEFCGGTHVHNSSEIGLFKILSEASIASGVRRIEAVTGAGVEKYILSQAEQIKTSERRIEELLDTKKKLEKEIAELKTKDNLGQLDHILSLSSEEKGIKIFKGKVHADSMDELKSFGDEMRNKIKSGVGVLIAQMDDKVGIVAVVSDDLIKEKKLSAGKIVGELAKLVGGGGGGRAHLATAGGKDVGQIVTALTKVEKIVGSFL